MKENKKFLSAGEKKRRERQAEALRANLKRRKEQVRKRNNTSERATANNKPAESE
tara:strand:+ start:74 stop:238 length:165 start_codon:yes stop_codon:yes gene_type:complete